MSWTHSDLIERDDALELATTAIAGARDGSGMTLVFDAPAGLGKSSVLGAAARAAREDGAIVLRARGDELGRHVPHGVLQQLFARIALDLECELARTHPGSPASQLLAAIGLDAIDVRVTPGQIASGTWMLLDLLAELRGAPIVLVVDDLQLVDRTSLEALAFVASRIDAMRCSMLIGQRSGEPCIDDQLAARLRSAAATRLDTLELLSLDGAARIAASIDSTIGDDQVRIAHEATGGNPLLLTEVLRHLDDHVPARVREHVRLRLARVGDATDVAAAAAVLGRWATVARVSQVAGVAVEYAERQLDAVAREGVVHREGEGVRFSHPLLAAAALDVATDDAQRRSLAKRAAQVIEADGANPTAIASMLLDAPIAGDPTTSSRLVAGATAALAAGAPDEAIQFLERAIAEPIDDEQERIDALLLASSARQLVRDWAGTIEVLTAVLALTTLPAARSELRATIANVRIGASDIVGAMREFEAAALEIEHVPGAATRFVELRASGQAFGRFLGMSTDNEDPLFDVLPADPAADTHEHRILLANVAMAHIFANDDAGRIQRLAHRGLAGRTLLEESGVDAPVLFTAMAALTWTDDYSVLDALDAAVDLARERGSVLGHATAMSARGGTLWRRGDLARARADLEAAIDARHDGWTAYLPFVGYCAARAALDLGDRAAVADLVDVSVPSVDLAVWGPIEPFAHAALGVARIARGEHELALDYMLEAVAAADRQRSTAIAISDWRFEAVELAAQLERCDGVRDLARETLERARRLGASRPLGMALRGMASVVSDQNEQLQLLDEAVDVLAAGSVRVELARTLMARGRVTGTRSDLERACEIAADCGARLILEQLAVLGVAARAPDEHELLTSGELRVAELAAAGKTNREIAHALFVTIKAVEFHLSNAYRKLGIRGRRDLVDALTR